MSLSATCKPSASVLVGMGQIAAIRAPQRMRAILGSCIGLALYHAGTQTAVMAHIVLPESAGREGSPGKFADTAVPHMLGLLREQGVPLFGLTAKFAGGANMFNGAGPLRIGDANAEAVVAALSKAGIRVAGQDVGGTSGRRVEFDAAAGELIVEYAGRPARTL